MPPVARPGFLERIIPRHHAGPRFDLSDFVVASCLVLLIYVLLIYRSDALWMQYWDESRIANNALEAARDGHWLAPTYHGVVDHWSTKPPLMVWAVAALFKAGLPALWALRLPNIAAALATCGLIWGTLRFSLKDAAAAALGGTLLLCSTLYVGIHVTRTGDYEGLESLFILGYVLSFWAAFADPVRPNWLFVAAGCIVGAVMTKGVAGALALPGCALFFLARPSRLWVLIKDGRTWVCAVATVALCLGYYLSRETYDPGYLQLVIDNELGGRFNAVIERHSEGPLFYVNLLFADFKPGMVLLLFAPVALFAADQRRRGLALVTLASGVAMIVVLSFAKTKIFHYAAPAIPLLSVAAAIGVSEVLQRLAEGNPTLVRRAARTTALVTVGFLCAYSVPYVVYYSLRWPAISPDAWTSEVRDGLFITWLHDQGLTPPVTVVEDQYWTGPPAGGGPGRFANQIVDFYASYYRDSWRIEELAPGQAPRPGSMVITCEPSELAWLNLHYTLSIAARQYGCILGRIEPKP